MPRASGDAQADAHMSWAGLIKVCLAYEHGLLPGNLHFNEPNPNSASLKAGILKVQACSADMVCPLHLNHPPQ